MKLTRTENHITYQQNFYIHTQTHTHIFIHMPFNSMLLYLISNKKKKEERKTVERGFLMSALKEYQDEAIRWDKKAMAMVKNCDSGIRNNKDLCLIRKVNSSERYRRCACKKVTLKDLRCNEKIFVN